MNQNKSDRNKMTADPLRARVRTAGQGTERKRRGLFFVMDILLLIGIVGIIFAMVIAFTPLSLFGEEVESREVLYTVEFSGVDQSFVSAFREGDAVTDAVTGSQMGEIAQIKIREYEAYTNVPTTEKDPELGKHVVRKETNEKLKTVTIVLRVTAEYTPDVGYMAEECRVAVGKEYQLRFPSYTDNGVCIALEHTATEGEVAN